MSAELLNPTKALAFRLTHVDNVPWILDNGLRSRSSDLLDPRFRVIGNPDIIARRNSREVPIAPGGALSDYVPFYLTPWTPMQLNVLTGHGVPQVNADELAIVVVALRSFPSPDGAFLITDRNAALVSARFVAGLEGLDLVDWPLLQRRDFRRDADDPARVERYAAEALVHRLVPIDRIAGIAVRAAEVAARLGQGVQSRRLATKVVHRPHWFTR